MPSPFHQAEIFKALSSISASQRVLDVLARLHDEALGEPPFAKRARKNWALAGRDEVQRWIELREGDLLETLKTDMPSQVDFLLLDIWTPLALPTLKLVKPHLKKGAIVLADNVEAAKEGYRDLLEYVGRPESGFRSTILPYGGGFQMLVYVGFD
ncbi:O-methyltransferase [Magnaporthiopsis poae ATCC 64411]|uniref:O-methyltransferase n=1 Tax=Magnaporthiopsis poae (strain ATCC 64411 / 73-15) TaxID=644358 RepID=A0A0C4DPP9_MAGP6|nr:O-methyltransferase [Magnaporthiopsis poae ATCC 64411]